MFFLGVGRAGEFWPFFPKRCWPKERSEHFTWGRKMFEYEYISILNVRVLKQENANNQCGIFTFYGWRLIMEIPIIINHQIKSKKVKRKMESNITKILIKKKLENVSDSSFEKARFQPSPVNSSQRGIMTLPFWCSLSLITLPSEAPAPTPHTHTHTHKKETYPS